MVTALAHVSGAHLNPAVTAGFWVTKRLDTLHAVFYCLAQLLGSLAAAYALRFLLPEATWRPVALGSTDLVSDFTRIQGMALESIATFFVVYVFFAGALEGWDSFRKLGGLAVGLAVAMGALLAQPFTGASMNPARTFGPALAARHWINHAVYWVGPLFGGVIAAVVYDRLFVDVEEDSAQALSQRRIYGQKKAIEAGSSARGVLRPYSNTHRNGKFCASANVRR